MAREAREAPGQGGGVGEAGVGHEWEAVAGSEFFSRGLCWEKPLLRTMVAQLRFIRRGSEKRRNY